MTSSPPVPVPGPAGSAESGKRLAAAQKRKTQRVRLSRLATTLTLVGVLAFGAFGAWAVKSFLTQPSAQDTEIEGARAFLAGIASAVKHYVDVRGRMPANLGELRAPDLPSDYDAEPWDRWARPVEYRVVNAADRVFRLRSYGPDRQPDTADDIVWPSGQPWS
jgi:hypothetical protein